MILYLTLGLGYSLRLSALIIGSVALVILLGAGAVGKLGDRFGHLRVVTIALGFYGVGYLIPAFTTNRGALVAAIPFAALGGGALMTMSCAVLMPLMPEDEDRVLGLLQPLSRPGDRQRTEPRRARGPTDRARAIRRHARLPGHACARQRHSQASLS